MKQNLKTVLFAFAMILMSANTVFSQIEKGNIIIDPYYGYPNFGKGLVEAIANGDGTVDVNGNSSGTDLNLNARGIGPAGLRFEYMVADNFGLGFDFIYNSASIDFQADSLNNDGTVNSTYDVTAFSRRFRFHIRANYHFVQQDAFDAYVGFGAGTNTRSFGYNTDFPNYDNESATGSLIPVSARIALGSRFYFTDNLGLNLELGIGGPLVSAGVSLKF